MLISLWKSQMVSALICYDLIGFADETLTCVPKFIARQSGAVVSNPQYLEWIKIDQCVLTWITSTIPYQIHKEVHDLCTC